MEWYGNGFRNGPETDFRIILIRSHWTWMNRIEPHWFLTDLHRTKFKNFSDFFGMIRKWISEWSGNGFQNSSNSLALNLNESDWTALIFNRFASNEIQKLFGFSRNGPETDFGIGLIHSDWTSIWNFLQGIYIYSTFFLSKTSFYFETKKSLYMWTWNKTNLIFRLLFEWERLRSIKKYHMW